MNIGGSRIRKIQDEMLDCLNIVNELLESEQDDGDKNKIVRFKLAIKKGIEELSSIIKKNKDIDDDGYGLHLIEEITDCAIMFKLDLLLMKTNKMP